MSDNWLKSRMSTLGIGTSELSRSLEAYDISISRQVLDNWLRMEDERIPVGVGNVQLIYALSQILGYEDSARFLADLGHDLEVGEYASTHMTPILAKLRSYDDDEAEPIAIILEQILERWEKIEEVMRRNQSS
jgi:hypothetical protein